MKKFFFCINTLSRAGAETALLEFMRRLAEKGYEIDLLVITGIGEMAEELKHIASQTETLNLAAEPEFEKSFIRLINLRKTV